MVNTEIRLIIFFAAEDGEALFSQQKQDWELTMAQIMNSLLRSEEHTSELQSHSDIAYAVFCLAICLSDLIP